MKHIIIISLLFLITACQKDEQYSQVFHITNCQKINKEFSGFSKIKLTVENKSNLTLGCWAYIKIKKGNTIIETSTQVFSSLNPGESQIEESWFDEFDKHSEYDKAEIELNWTIDSVGYSRNYSF